jgi:hypothetical protein
MAKTTFNYNKGDVIDFKLMSGEEIIGRLHEDHPDEYVLMKPMSLINTPNGGLGMMPSPIASDHVTPVMLNKHAVALHCKCEQSLASQYLEKTTGITMPTSGLI